MESAFAKFLSDHAGQVNEFMAACYRGKTDNADIDRYLYAPLAEFSEHGGKRHRPLICMLAALAVGGSPERALRSAAAIEHFQSAALIHDDIADHGQLRRGIPCMYLTEGLGLAINCGDYELASVTGSVLEDDELEDAVKVRVLKELSAMTIRTIEGQALDLGWVRDGRFDITIHDYLTMATLKTAHYSGAVPLAIGAILGGGSERQIEALRSFGMGCGLAFQIQDDLLNVVGEHNPHDKDFRCDITEGKRTLIAVHSLRHADPELHDELLGLLTSGTTDPAELARAVEIFESTGSIEFAHTYALDLIDRAKGILADIDLADECRSLLFSMADFFVERLK